MEAEATAASSRFHWSLGRSGKTSFGSTHAATGRSSAWTSTTKNQSKYLGHSSGAYWAASKHGTKRRSTGKSYASASKDVSRTIDNISHDP